MTAPTFPITNRGAQRPSFPMIEISHLTRADAADWQVAVMAECRRLKMLTPSLTGWLKGAGLLSRCTFLSSDGPGEPLCFRDLGEPMLPVLGRAWSRSMLNPPDDQDPHIEFAQNVGAQYAESIGAGETIFSRVIVSGVGRPFVYTHALYGWEDRGRRAVLAAVDIQTLH